MRNFKKYDNRNLFNLRKNKYFFVNRTQKNKSSKQVFNQVKNKLLIKNFIKNGTPVLSKHNFQLKSKDLLISELSYSKKPADLFFDIILLKLISMKALRGHKNKVTQEVANTPIEDELK